MITASRLAYFSSIHIKLWEENGNLKCSAPKGKLTSVIASELKDNKEQILRLLNTDRKSADIFRDFPIKKATKLLSYRLSPQHRRYAADHGWDSERTWNTIVLHLLFPFKYDVFRESVDVVINRHECLRTIFPIINGERRQQIQDTSSITITNTDFDSNKENDLKNKKVILLNEINDTSFDSENGPLGKLAFLSGKGEKNNCIVFSIHRILMDAPSARLLTYELLTLSQQIVKGNLDPSNKSEIERNNNLSYTDYSEWLNNLEDRGYFHKSREYWKEEFSKSLPDPFGFNKQGEPKLISKNGGLAKAFISKKNFYSLKKFAMANGWLFPITLFSIFVVSLWKQGSGDDLVIDTSLLGRHKSELKTILGYFSNAAAIRVEISSDMSFADVVKCLTQKYVLAEENQYYQYNAVVDDLGIDRERVLYPLSGILFNNLEIDTPAEQPLDSKTTWEEVSLEVRYAVMFYALSYPDCMGFQLKHRLPLLKKDKAISIVNTFCKLVEKLIKEKSNIKLSDLVADIG